MIKLGLKPANIVIPQNKVQYINTQQRGPTTTTEPLIWVPRPAQPWDFTYIYTRKLSVIKKLITGPN